ncbi:MAG: hypothetical protein ACK4NC_05445 [Candidatus Gracilibacteria bacterium]
MHNFPSEYQENDRPKWPATSVESDISLIKKTLEGEEILSEILTRLVSDHTKYVNNCMYLEADWEEKLFANYRETLLESELTPERKTYYSHFLHLQDAASIKEGISTILLKIHETESPQIQAKNIHRVSLNKSSESMQKFAKQLHIDPIYVVEAKEAKGNIILLPQVHGQQENIMKKIQENYNASQENIEQILKVIEEAKKPLHDAIINLLNHEINNHVFEGSHHDSLTRKHFDPLNMSFSVQFNTFANAKKYGMEERFIQTVNTKTFVASALSKTEAASFFTSRLLENYLLADNIVSHLKNSNGSVTIGLAHEFIDLMKELSVDTAAEPLSFILAHKGYNVFVLESFQEKNHILSSEKSIDDLQQSLKEIIARLPKSLTS